MQSGSDPLDQSSQIVTVQHVVPDSPACKAGVQEGDVIRSVDGTLLSEVNTLTDLILAKKPGSVTYLELARNGRRIRARVTLGTRVLPAFRFRPIELPNVKTGSVDVNG